MFKPRHALYGPEGEGESSGGSAVADPPAPAAAPAADPAPAASVSAPKPADAPAAKAAEAPSAPEPKKEVQPQWAENWRELLAGGDDKELKQLGRYASPQAIWKKARELEAKLSSGEVGPTLPKNPTADQLKEWREAHGIPPEADKYDLGDAAKDIPKEVLGIYLQHAHATHQTPDQVKAGLQAWSDIQKATLDQRAESDYQTQLNGEEELRAEWGGDFRRNINLIHGLLDSVAAPDLKSKILGGRFADGTPLGSSPEFLRMLVDLALIQNPVGVVVPGAGANPIQATEDEISRIEKIMREKPKEYYRDEKLQTRLRDLYAAKEKLQERKAA